MSRILRETSERKNWFEIKYDKHYNCHKVLSGWSDKRAERFKKDIIEYIAGSVPKDVSKEDVIEKHSELCDIFAAWMQGKTTEYDSNIFKKLKFSSISPDKGFYIMGVKGTRKTTFMKAFIKKVKAKDGVWQFEYEGFPMVTGFEIKNEYAAYGVRKTGYNGEFEGGIEKYFKPMHEETNREWEVLCIDDFLYEGEDNDTSHYGNSTKVIEDVIKARMDNGLLTFITSNFEPDSFSEPVVDRIKESMNIIFINDKESSRK